MTIVNDITNHFASYPVFTYRDVVLYLRNNKKRTEHPARILSHMKSAGRLYTVRKGVYTFKLDDAISGFAYAPFYYGLLSALTMRDLWTQNSRPDIMTIKKVRRSRVHIFEDKNDVIFLHHIPTKYFFGFDIIKYGELKVPVSDPEKTLVDLFYYKITLSIQNYGELLKVVNRKKLNGYLKLYDKRTAGIALNFVKKYKPLADSGELDNPY